MSPPPAALSAALRRLLWVISIPAGLLAINSLYLLAVTVTEHLTGAGLENPFYLVMFLVHLGLGLLLIVPTLVFGALHFRRARLRPNRYAIRAGIGLYLTLILLFGSGLLLTRFDFFEVNDPAVRSVAYWVHVLTPLAAIWLFLLHRLAGPPLRWRPAAGWAGAAVGISLVAVALHLLWASPSPRLERTFMPALAKVPPMDGALATIPAEHLMGDAVCAECHGDIAERHAGSMHRFSSFNNPAYRKTIEDTRAELLERDGHLDGVRLCAACHDPVPLFSGRFDDPAYDPAADPGAEAGITCLSCHAITAINSPRGNGDYSLVDPRRYPFAFSDNPFLRSLNRQLIKAKPAFHKRTLLKPVHRSAEFCAGCHKVHLPPELNHYRWLRGQNHYDSFRLSGVSGHRVDSFYYPAQAKSGCNDCHMPLRGSDDPAARSVDALGKRAVHDHLFAAANTAVAEMVGRPDTENAERLAMMQRAVRVDLFGLKEDGRIDGKLQAPLRPVRPELTPGAAYLLEVVVRTDGIGHALTQGTADSNEVWLEVEAILGDGHGEGLETDLRAGPRDRVGADSKARISAGSDASDDSATRVDAKSRGQQQGGQTAAGVRVIGHSGGLTGDGSVDDLAWFGNAYLLDRDGNRITRRNAQDIFVALYDHQIPPGAASVVHYRVEIPTDARGTLQLNASLKYRKFDTRFYRYLLGDAFQRNDLPITTLARDQLRLPISPIRVKTRALIAPVGVEERAVPRAVREVAEVAASARTNSTLALPSLSRIEADGDTASHSSRIAKPLSIADAKAADQIDQTRPADPIAVIPAWQRWNDYGIGLLRQGKRGESRQAEAAFQQVEALGGAPGPLNLARVLHREGRLEEAAAALARAQSANLPHGEAPPWTIAWYTALIARDLGDLDRAIGALEALAETRFSDARARGFDFSGDDRMLVELGRTLYERARRERGPERQSERLEFLTRARARLEQALELDPESAAAHHNLSLVLAELDAPRLASEHRRLHQYYRTDDNAIERAVSLHRSRNPAADHAAEPVAIYALTTPERSPAIAGHPAHDHE